MENKNNSFDRSLTNNRSINSEKTNKDNLKTKDVKFDNTNGDDFNIEKQEIKFNFAEANFVPTGKVQNTSGTYTKNENLSNPDVLNDINNYEDLKKIPSESKNDNEKNSFPQQNNTDNKISDNNVFNDNLNSGVNPNGISENNAKDNRSLKEKSEDFKKDVKDKYNNAKDKYDKAKEGIKNTPENIKNKANEIKNAPENIKKGIDKKREDLKNNYEQKKNDLKNKWDNRPKSLDDAKNRAKNRAKEGSKNLKTKAKSGASNLKEKTTSFAKDKINNSKVGRTVNNVKEKIDNTKKTIQFLLKYKYVILAGLAAVLVFFGIVFVGSFFSTSSKHKAPVGKDEIEGYSKIDEKTIVELRKISEKYGSKGALGMAAVILPYFQEFQDGNLRKYLEVSKKSAKDDVKDEEEEDFDPDSEYLDDIVPEDGEKEIEDDQYLQIFRLKSIRKKFSKVMKNINSSEDEFKEYLKSEYFKKDKGANLKDFNTITGYNGYSKMIKNLKKSADEEKFFNELIENIYDIEDQFDVYFPDRTSCSSSLTELSYVDVNGIISGEAAVVLKDTFSGIFSEIKNAPTLYGTDDYHLSLKRYAMGVAYAEIGYGVTMEASAKADMIAAQSFVLSRITPGKLGTNGMGFGTDKIGDKTIFYMRANTNDQDFCDVYEGCMSGSRYAKENSSLSSVRSSNLKPPLSEQEISNLEKWYDEIAGQFIYDSKNEVFGGTQKEPCSSGDCMSQNNINRKAELGMDYMALLFNESYTKEGFTLYKSDTSTISAVSTVCTNSSNGKCTIADEDFIYYSQKDPAYSEQEFCGVSGTNMYHYACGVTSIAMVLANLYDSNITPLTTNSDGISMGLCGSYGTSGEFFSKEASKYGLTYDSTIKSNSTNIQNESKKIEETIRNGGLVIINVNSSWLGSGSGHYIVAKGLDENNNLLIADPYATSLNNPVKNNVPISDMLNNYVNNNFGWYMFKSNKSEEIVKKYCPVGEGNGYLGNPLNPNDTTKHFVGDDFPRYRSGGSHSGIDLNSSVGADYGDPVYAMDAGVVIYAGTYSGNCYGHCSGSNMLGLGIKIDMGNGYTVWYGHFSKRVVQNGDKVQKGQLIGYIGNSGNSGGAHLHLTLENQSLYSKYGWNGARGYDGRGFMNPAKYINSSESYVGKSK